MLNSKSSQSFTKGFANALQNQMRALLGLVLAVIVAAAILVAVMATIESRRYDKTVEQILGIVSATRSYAAAQSSFAQQPGEDMIGTLARVGQLPASTVDKSGNISAVANQWGAGIRAVIIAPSILRIESSQPASACRRVAQFLISSASALGLQRVDISQSPSATNPVWGAVYSEDTATKSHEEIEAACGEWGTTALAAQFHVR